MGNGLYMRELRLLLHCDNGDSVEVITVYQ